uniref:Uncharacterized protein n=1 Tax=Asparagus officinalis TaxID=4686 RepID=Q2XNS5_ASPOF|nr:hypothetical protein 9.t00011 [Asparagus officinalis]
MTKNADEAWEFLESLSEKTMQWEHYDDRVSLVPHSKSSGPFLESNIASEAKMVTILRRLEALEIKERAPAQIYHVSAPGCHNCQSPTHISEEYPLLGNNHTLEQMNAAFQRPRNDPFSPTYNPGWRNHPNFAWNQGNSTRTQNITPAST